MENYLKISKNISNLVILQQLSLLDNLVKLGKYFHLYCHGRKARLVYKRKHLLYEVKRFYLVICCINIHTVTL